MARLGTRWRVLLAMVLTVVLLSTPAVAGFTAVKVAGHTLPEGEAECIPCKVWSGEVLKNPEVKALAERYGPLPDVNDAAGKVVSISEIRGAERDLLVKKALSNKGTQQISSEFEKSGFVIDDKGVKVIQATTRLENDTIISYLVSIPLVMKEGNSKEVKNKQAAVVTYVSNRFGEAAVANVISQDGISIKIYDNDTGRVLSIGSIACDFCQWAVGGLCAWFITDKKACPLAYARLCARVPNPLWFAICGGSCWVICNYLVTYKACSWGAYNVCKAVRLCQ